MSTYSAPIASAPIAIFYEHPTWFQPLFAELDRRGLPYEAIRADRYMFDPAVNWRGRHTVFFNRMSPSAWERGRGPAVFFTHHVLQQLESQGVPVINGAAAYRIDSSKGAQLELLHRLGIAAPNTRVVYDQSQLPQAAGQLEFPLLIKPNMGGNGAGIVRVDSLDELIEFGRSDTLANGPDGVFLLQEYHPPQGNRIVRVETLEGRYLYGLHVHLGSEREAFSICPADVGCAIDHHQPTTAPRAVAYRPPADTITDVERIVDAAGFDIGGVEYLISDRDGLRYVYDLNGLSNFVTNPLDVLSFDPIVNVVDSLERRLVLRAA